MDFLYEGLNAGASIKAVADLIGICSRTLRRWGLDISDQGFSVDRRKGAPREVAHRFTAKERQRVIDSVNDPRFADLTPAQIVAILAEERMYVGSESTIYRIMRQEGLLNHRGRARSPREPRPVPVLEATGVYQVLAWDITLLPGHVKGQFYYLYMVMDVWSRRILGVEVHERECSELASAFFDRVCRNEGISKETAAILHSDNGAPMRSFTLAAKTAELGVSAVVRGTGPGSRLLEVFPAVVAARLLVWIETASVCSRSLCSDRASHRNDLIYSLCAA